MSLIISSLKHVHFITSGLWLKIYIFQRSLHLQGLWLYWWLRHRVIHVSLHVLCVYVILSVINVPFYNETKNTFRKVGSKEEFCNQTIQWNQYTDNNQEVKN